MRDARPPRSSTRQRILEAAFDVITEVGLDGFTMTEVERRVGLAVGRGSIYRHFPTKESLMQAAVEWEVRRNRSVTHDAQSAVREEPNPAGRRIAGYHQMLDDLGRFDRLFGLMLIQGNRVPEIRETIRETVQTMDAPVDGAEQAAHVVAMAALGGYHLFSIMQGQPFHGVGAEEFVRMVAELAGGRPQVESSGGRSAIEAPDVVEVFEEATRRTLASDLIGFAELFAVDGVHDLPFAPSGPQRLHGRDNIRAHFAQMVDRPRYETEFHPYRIHRTADPETIVVELDARGVVAATGQTYTQRYVEVITVHAGEIVLWRDYWSPLESERILAGTSEALEDRHGE